MIKDSGAPIRRFETGATRDDSTDKFEYDGFLSPFFLNDFARYMHKHRMQPDGKMRDSDNWQNGMPLQVYVSSAWRHFVDFWALSRGYTVIDENDKNVEMLDAVMGLVFNLQGYWHEVQKASGIDIRRSTYKRRNNRWDDQGCYTEKDPRESF